MAGRDLAIRAGLAEERDHACVVLVGRATTHQRATDRVGSADVDPTRHPSPSPQPADPRANTPDQQNCTEMDTDPFPPHHPEGLRVPSANAALALVVIAAGPINPDLPHEHQPAQTAA